MGVEFRYSNSITFEKLVEDWDKTNMARPVPVREEAVFEYNSLMQAGSPAPSPILWKTDAGLEVLDGIQRLVAASMADSTQLSGYIVECDSIKTVTAIRVLANARLQGRQEPPEWTRKRAVEVLVLDQGLSLKEVARMGGWSVSQIKTTANVLKWHKLVESINGPTMTDSLLAVVASNTNPTVVAKCAEPVANFFRLLKDGKFSTVDATPYVEEFFSGITDTNKPFGKLRKRFEQFNNNPEVVARIKGRKGAVMADDILLRRSLRAALTAIKNIQRKGDAVVHVEEFFQLTKKIDAGLHDLKKKKS